MFTFLRVRVIVVVFQGSATMDFHAVEKAINATDLDPKDSFSILNDIEIQSQYLATSLDHLTENLSNLLHSVYNTTIHMISHPHMYNNLGLPLNVRSRRLLRTT